MKFDKRSGVILIPKCSIVVIQTSYAYVLAFFILTNHYCRLVVISIREFTVKEMVILRSWTAHAQCSTVHDKTSIRIEKIIGVLGLLIHRLHVQLSPVKENVPYLLALEGENNYMSSLISQFNVMDSAFIHKQCDLQVSRINKRSFLFREIISSQ